MCIIAVLTVGKARAVNVGDCFNPQDVVDPHPSIELDGVPSQRLETGYSRIKGERRGKGL